MRTAYSYIRFSDDVQRRGDSVRRQTELRNGWLLRHPDCTLDESLRLNDLGVSAFRGRNLKEGALAGFLEAVRTGRVCAGSLLIVESLDRLSRDQIRPALQLFLSILDAGVSIVTLSPEREYAPTDQDPLVLIEPLIYFSRAHEESSTKSHRLSQSWAARRKAAGPDAPITTVGPKWLVMTDGKWAIVPERGRVVRSIFQWSREGSGNFEIVKRLNERKVPNFGPGKRWNTSYVRMILTDRRAIGEYQPKRMGRTKVPVGDPIPNYYPAVVTEDEFYATLGLVKRRKGTPGRGGSKRENVLAGLVFNAADGEKMYYECASRGRQAHLDTNTEYYGRNPTAGRSFPYRPVELAVLSELESLSVAKYAPGSDRLSEKAALLETLRGRLAETEERLRKANELAGSTEDFDTLLTTITLLGRQKKDIHLEIERLRTEVGETKTELADTQSMIRLRETAKGEDREALNRKLRVGVAEVVESVWLLIDRITKFKKVCHVQINLKEGGHRYRVLSHPTSMPQSLVLSRPSYADADLRVLGQEGGKSTSSVAPSPSQRRQKRTG